jgi:hypothetical protein
MRAKPKEWDGQSPVFVRLAERNRPKLTVDERDWLKALKADSTSNDGLAPGNDAFAAALRAAGDNRVTTPHLPTDHSYSDQRTALSTAVLQWLATVLPDQHKP